MVRFLSFPWKDANGFQINQVFMGFKKNQSRGGNFKKEAKIGGKAKKLAIFKLLFFPMSIALFLSFFLKLVIFLSRKWGFILKTCFFVRRSFFFYKFRLGLNQCRAIHASSQKWRTWFRLPTLWLLANWSLSTRFGATLKFFSVASSRFSCFFMNLRENKNTIVQGYRI